MANVMSLKLYDHKFPDTWFLARNGMMPSVTKPCLEQSYVNRILHLWAFHMKFMKLAEG